VWSLLFFVTTVIVVLTDRGLFHQDVDFHSGSDVGFAGYTTFDKKAKFQKEAEFKGYVDFYKVRQWTTTYALLERDRQQKLGHDSHGLAPEAPPHFLTTIVVVIVLIAVIVFLLCQHFLTNYIIDRGIWI
jgi:hypothetical protein